MAMRMYVMSPTHTASGLAGMTLRYRFGHTGRSWSLSAVRTKRRRGFTPWPAAFITRATRLWLTCCAAPAQLERHASVAIAGESVLDVVNHLNELVVQQGRRGYAPPSDGTAFGPLMIDDVALSLTRRRRGDLGFVFGDTRGLDLLSIEIAAAVLRRASR